MNPVKPVAGHPFDVTFSGTVLKKVELANLYMFCNVNGVLAVQLWAGDQGDITPGQWSHTFTVPADQATRGIWSCEHIVINWAAVYEWTVSVENLIL